ncbi:MAG: PQQ-like beta-propeller repeat protein [Alphaproteobacteria bacterium]|nr:PQQ-like beta-propeller repeat protein [Alphaproteobacteria bacterium]
MAIIPNGFYRGPRRFQGVAPTSAWVIGWKLQTDGAIHCIPALGPQGRVYVGTSSQSLYAIDTDSGAVAWTFDTGYRITTNSPVVDTAGNVYLPAVSTISLAPDRTVRWAVELGGAARSSAWLGSQNDLYVTTSVWNTGDVPALFRLDTDTGEVVWSTPFPGLHTIQSTPTEVAGGIICFTAGDGKVYGVDKTDGAVRAAFQVGGRMGCRPAATANGTMVFVITLDDGGTDKLVAINTGVLPWSLAWSVAPPGQASSPLSEPICTPAGRQVYAGFDAVVAYVEAHPLWQTASMGGAQRMALDGAQNLLFGRQDLHVSALDANGQLLQDAAHGGSGVGLAVDDDGVVYFGDSAGFVYAITSPEATPDRRI